MKTFSLKATLTLAMIGLILTGLGRAPNIAYGQTSTWSKPVPLSPEGLFAWFPDVTADLAGGVHVFWASGRTVSSATGEGYDTVVYCQPTDTGCSRMLEVAAKKQIGGAQYNTRPAAIVDSQGTLHLLWREVTIIRYSTTSVIGPVSARGWTPPRRLSGDSTAYYLNIAQDQRGVLHLAWSENIPQNRTKSCSFCSDIFYRQSTDLGQTWTAPVDVSKTDWGSEKPQIVFGPGNVIFMAWEEGHDFYVGRGTPISSMIAASLDGGLSWERPTTFIFPGDTPQSIAAGVDGQGKLVVVWQQIVGRGVYYQVSTDQGQSWSAPVQIPGVSARSDSALDDYDMVADAAGHLHLVLVGQDAQKVAGAAPQSSSVVPNNVYHLEWDGTAWSQPFPIFTVIGDMPEWPRIAVSLGNQLHVVWFVRDAKHISDSDNGQYRIWYAHGVSSAPPVAPIMWPSPTPTTSTPTRTPLSPPPTPPTALDPNLAGVDVPPGTVNSLYTDFDEEMLLAQSLIPVALVLLAVVVWTRRRRR
jgi:hypothetical protein